MLKKNILIDSNKLETKRVTKGSKNSFFKNIIALCFGTSFSSFLIILAEPVTSRLFPPAAFGAVSIFYSIVYILSMLSCLKYEMAIVLPNDEQDAEKIFVLCFSILVIFSFIVTLLTWFFGHRLFVLLNIQILHSFLWFFPVAIFFTGFEVLLRRWHTRKERFQKIAISRIGQAVPRVSAEIIGGGMGWNNSHHLAFYRLLSFVSATGILLWDFIKFDVLFVIKHNKIAPIIQIAHRYIKFPTYEFLSSLFMLISFHSPIILLNYFFDTNEAGLFAKAFYLLYLPALLFGESISQAFLQLSANKLSKGEDISQLVVSISYNIISLSLLPFSILAIIGPDFFSVALGQRWIDSGIYAQIITPWLFLVLLNNSVTTLYVTLEKQEVGMFFNIIMLISRVAILFFGGIIIKNAKITILLFSCLSTIIILFKYLYINKIVGVDNYKLFVHFIKCFTYSVPSIFLVIYFKFSLHLPSIFMIGIAFICSIPYIGIILYKNPPVLSVIGTWFRR